MISRFTLFSVKDKCIHDYGKIVGLLPNPNSTHIKGENRYLSDGRLHPNSYKETSFDFEFTDNVFELEKVHDSWIKFWEPYIGILREIKAEYDFQYHLNYEVIIYNLDYPSIYLSVKFSKVLSDLGIEFSMFFYNEG